MHKLLLTLALICLLSSSLEAAPTGTPSRILQNEKTKKEKAYKPPIPGWPEKGTMDPFFMVKFPFIAVATFLQVESKLVTGCLLEAAVRQVQKLDKSFKVPKNLESLILHLKDGSKCSDI